MAIFLLPLTVISAVVVLAEGLVAVVFFAVAFVVAVFFAVVVFLVVVFVAEVLALTVFAMSFSGRYGRPHALDEETKGQGISTGCIPSGWKGYGGSDG